MQKLTEKEYVIGLFEGQRQHWEKRKIALYGLSHNSQVIAEAFSEAEDCEIVGLLDAFQKSGSMYGVPIIDLDDVVSLGADTIIIVARANSTKFIVERIEGFCRENNIRLYDLQGEDRLAKVEKGAAKNHPYFAVSMDSLKAAILKADVVSFDVFDTLIMRQCLYPKDVWEIMARRYDLPQWFPFVRHDAEHIMSRQGSPKLEAIYDYLYENMAEYGQQYPELLENIAVYDEKYWQDLRQKEIATEKSLLLPRQAMVEVFKFALEHKPVYIVSDMYLPEAEMEDILANLGITGYKKLLVSSEYNTFKTQQLFDVYQQQVADDLGKSVQDIAFLHIGDNEDVDIMPAKLHDMEGFHIHSAIDMLELTNAFTKLTGQRKISEMTLDERLFIGLFISKMFNSPFSLHNSVGKLQINSPEILGYSLVAPMLTAFMLWLCQQVKNKYDKILLGARDGYLIEKLYHEMEKYVSGLPEAVYFLTSRYAAISADCYDEESIIYAANISFNGKYDDCLRNRFFLREEDIQRVKENETLQEYVARHVTAIKKRSAELKGNYWQYMNQLGITAEKTDGSEDRLAFFDFVASGTCQMCLEHILRPESGLQGFYFIQLLEEYYRKENMKTASFMESGNVYELKSFLSNNYFLLENVLLSLKATIKRFDVNGEPVYGQDKRSQVQLDYTVKLQEAVVAFFRDYLALAGVMETEEQQAIAPSFMDDIYSLTAREYSHISDCPFFEEKQEDEFCNREYKIEQEV